MIRIRLVIITIASILLLQACEILKKTSDKKVNLSGIIIIPLNLTLNNYPLFIVTKEKNLNSYLESIDSISLYIKPIEVNAYYLWIITEKDEKQLIKKADKIFSHDNEFIGYWIYMDNCRFIKKENVKSISDIGYREYFFLAGKYSIILKYQDKFQLCYPAKRNL